MTDKPDGIDEAMANSRRAIDESRTAITRKMGMLEDRVHETLDDVKRTFDIRHQVQEHPWLIVGGSILAGYALGSMVSRPSTSDDAPASSHAEISRVQPLRSVRTPATDNYATIKGEVFQVVIGTLWAMAKQAFNLPSTQSDRAAFRTQNAEPFPPPMSDQGVPPKANGHGGVQ
jgi:hypothetical protein